MMINDLNLFSTNEEIEEVASNELRYLLLPGLLGYIVNKNTKLERMEVVKKSQAYYLDFLKLCKLYQVCDFDLPKQPSASEEEERKSASAKPPRQEDFILMADRRKVKMERFKKQKETEVRLKELYDKVKEEHVDDEIKREYYMTLLTGWIHSSLEELDSIKDELPILEHMAKMRISGAKTPTEEKLVKPKSTFRPFILTKDALQKQVIGAGYPSLPTYSVEEWYDQQVEAGRLPRPGEKMPGMPEPGAEAREYERQDLEKEANIQDDDPETLQKAREWDDWRDDHRRGWGNRQNMG
ncbi:immunoglobulin-binding protein 1-like isoform X2 [Lineus longissimus]